MINLQRVELVFYCIGIYRNPLSRDLATNYYLIDKEIREPQVDGNKWEDGLGKLSHLQKHSSLDT